MHATEESLLKCRGKTIVPKRTTLAVLFSSSFLSFCVSPSRARGKRTQKANRKCGKKHIRASAMRHFPCQTSGQILSRATKSNFPSAESSSIRPEGNAGLLQPK